MSPKTIAVWMGLSISLITTVIPLWSPCHHPCPCQSIPLATEERNLSKMQLPSQYPFPEIPQVLSHQDKTILRACPSHNLPVQPSMACFHFWPLHMGEILCLKYLSLKTVPTYTSISLCLLTPNPSPLPLCSCAPPSSRSGIHLCHTAPVHCEGRGPSYRSIILFLRCTAQSLG